MNEYYQPGSTPAPNAPGSSAVIRAQFASIALAFDKLPVMAGSENEIVMINSTGTGIIASGIVLTDFITVDGVATITNKTFAWADNTWDGFGTGATKNAGTGAGDVLLLAEADKLPVLDANNLINLNLEDAALTGEPTAPTPDALDSSDRIATTACVDEKLAVVNAAFPSDATPLMDGTAAPGVGDEFSRFDHRHPTDTSRAPAASPTLTGKAAIDNSSLTGIANHGLDVQQSGAQNDVGRAIFSQKSTYALGVSVSATETTAAKGDLQWLTRATGVVISTPLRLNYDGSIETNTVKVTGNIEFQGASRRITGDLSNASSASRLSVQSSTVNGATLLNFIPNGTGAESGIDLHNGSDVENSSAAKLHVSATEVQVSSGKAGTGIYLPIVCYVGGVESFRLLTNGDAEFAGTGAVKLHTGTTAQRPVVPKEGHFRRNSELGQWEGFDGTQWGGIGGASGGGGNPFCYENDITVTTDYTITTGKNAMSAGPIYIADGVTVTIPDGSEWSVV